MRLSLSNVHVPNTDFPGVWRVTLDPVEAGGPYNLTAAIRGNNVTLTDVLFGDVWLCGGQSNMYFKTSQVGRARWTPVRLSDELIYVVCCIINHTYCLSHNTVYFFLPYGAALTLFVQKTSSQRIHTTHCFIYPVSILHTVCTIQYNISENITVSEYHSIQHTLDNY